MFRKIKCLNILIVIMIFIQTAFFPANTLGNQTPNPADNPSAVKPTITVEQAVQKVKDNFTVPENYAQLSTGYNDYNNRATYSLNWNAVDQQSGSFHAEVDAATGDILNISQWEGPLKQAFSLPVLSAGEAEKIATDLISKAAGKHQAEMQLVKDEQQLFALNNSQSFMFNFRWNRVVNGIPFPGDGVNVSVSGEDGQILNYNYNWTQDLVFPEAANIISPEKARQVFTEAPMIQLQYYLPPVLNPQNSEPQRVLLVYQVNNEYNGGAIDALNGKPVTIVPQAGLDRPMNAVSSVSAGIATRAALPVSISRQTLAVSDDSGDKQLLSRDEAVNAVKKAIEISGDVVLRNSSLNPDWQNPGEQVWDLYWDTDSATMGGQQRSLNARVNARTGDVVNFSISDFTNPDDKSGPLDRAGAQKLAEGFLKRVQPERFGLVKMDSKPLYEGKTSANIQMFNYVRVANGLPVSNNGMNIVVDTVAKRITNYDLRWSNVEFPSPSGVIPLDQATERFLKERPLTLNYFLNLQQNGQQEVRLVYQPNTDCNMSLPAMLEAKTGDPMDWYGKSQSQWTKPHTFTDIQGDFAEKEIGIMGLTGAFGEYGETFHPNEKITAGSLLRAMIMADGNNRDRVLTDDDVLKIAKERGWLKEDLKLESELRPDDLSKIMIRLINMEPSARVKGIYAVPFKDADTIDPDSLGYIALAWGLNILKVENNTLQLKQTVSRAEAAYALVHAYAVEHPQNRY